ncbi:MAG: hypothetical protein HRU70_02970 [Phycisphaeraceae bacterium]|nr:MAG: hypothetical protein HRU70_02970 [Phycisphaeraceae bacterium]
MTDPSHKPKPMFTVGKHGDIIGGSDALSGSAAAAGGAELNQRVPTDWGIAKSKSAARAREVLLEGLDEYLNRPRPTGA